VYTGTHGPLHGIYTDHTRATAVYGPCTHTYTAVTAVYTVLHTTVYTAVYTSVYTIRVHGSVYGSVRGLQCLRGRVYTTVSPFLAISK